LQASGPAAFPQGGCDDLNDSSIGLFDSLDKNAAKSVGKRRPAAKEVLAMRAQPPDPSQTPDPWDLQEHHAPELELQLLRRGLRWMAAGRWACSRCGRSPLVGERLHVFARQNREQCVCDLCVKNAPEGSFGESVRMDRVRAGERPLSVRRAA
jgi:hypothetical protein